MVFDDYLLHVLLHQSDYIVIFSLELQKRQFYHLVHTLNGFERLTNT